MKIGFTGDIAFSEYTKDLYKKPQSISKKIYDFLNTNDYNILNFESPITKSNYTRKNSLAHKSPEEALTFIKEFIKNPIFSLANNHMMDFGRKGLLDTIKAINRAKIPFIGAGANEEEAFKSIILGHDVKVGVLAIQYKNYMVACKDKAGTSYDKNKNLIKKEIKKLKTKTDWIVVIYHGGEEFINTPLPYTRKKIKKFLNYGADIVVAHHPHTVQGYEKIGQKMIFYSLGNFIFDTDFQRAQRKTDNGMLLKINFTKENYTFESMPIHNKRVPFKIVPLKNNSDFKNIKRTYRQNVRKAANDLNKINENKKKLRTYRRYYSVNNLYIEKANIKEIIPFNELIAKNYIENLNNPPVFKTSNIIMRKVKRKYRRLKNANYKKFFYTKYGKIFK